MEWCINNLESLSDTEYLNNYRLYKMMSTIDKYLNTYNVKFQPHQLDIINKIVYQKNHLLTELPKNTILYPYSYCPLNHLHGVLELKIRANTIVYQCSKCNSIIVPRL